MVRDRLVYGINSNKVHERFINHGANLDLHRALNIARSHETAQDQLTRMHNQAEPGHIHAVHKGKQHHRGGRPSTHSAQKPKPKPSTRVKHKKCGNCGNAYHANKDARHARERTSNACGKQNHFSSVCRSKSVHTVDSCHQKNDSDEFFIDSVNSSTKF